MTNKVAILAISLLCCLVIALSISVFYLYFAPVPLEAPPKILEHPENLYRHEPDSRFREIGSVRAGTLREATFIFLFNHFPSLFGDKCAFLIKDESDGSDMTALAAQLTFNNHPIFPFRPGSYDRKYLVYRDPEKQEPAMFYYISRITIVSATEAKIDCGYYAGSLASAAYKELTAKLIDGEWQFRNTGHFIVS